MNHCKLLFITLLISTCSFGQTDTLNQMDKFGRKQGYWIIIGLHHPEKGYPPNGRIEEGNFLDNRKQGVWKKYYKDGKSIRIKANYEYNRPSGSYWKYWENGVLKEIGEFKKGKQMGSLIKYFRCGNIASERYYDQNGKIDGKVRFYYDNCGCPDSVSRMLEMSYQKKKGVDIDTLYRYYISGCLKHIKVNDRSGRVVAYEKYEDNCETRKYARNVHCCRQKHKINGLKNLSMKNTPDGFNSIYGKNSLLWKEGVFKDNKLWSGKIYLYSAKGVLSKIEIWKDGKFHSNGRLKEK